MPAPKTALIVSFPFVISIIFIIALAFQLKSATFSEKAENSRIPSGKQEYTVQQNGNAKPQITKVSIDPPDVRVGHLQNLSITIISDSKSNLVTTETKTDHKTVTLLLGLTKEEGNEKTYETSWKVEDTHDVTYHTKFIVRDAEGNQNEVTIAWTDPCGIQNGGDWTMTSDCTISATDGIDNGDVTIQSGTLTLNAPFIFNAGKTLTLSGGAILFNSSAEIRKDKLWQIDADNDGAPADSTMYAQESAPTNGKRRYLLTTSTIDCLDSNASVPDNSGTFYTTDRGDGSFDYNCDTTEEKNTATRNVCGGYPNCFATAPTPACGQSYSWQTCGNLGSFCTTLASGNGMVSCR